MGMGRRRLGASRGGSTLAALLPLLTLCGTCAAVRIQPQPSQPPAVERVRCDTTRGAVEVDVHRAWSPVGAARFLHLVRSHFYTDLALFRMNLWIVQFGATQRSELPRELSSLPPVEDDPPTDCGGRCTKGRLFDGALSFAGGGLHSRTDQVFFVHNIADQPIGHSPWEVPLGNVTAGMDVLKSLYGGYGESVDQGRLLREGNAYTRKEFPQLDYLLRCEVLSPPLPPPPPSPRPPPLPPWAERHRFGERVLFLPYVLGWTSERLWTPDVATVELVDLLLLLVVVAGLGLAGRRDLRHRRRRPARDTQ